jgi:hypothetical protein
MDWINVNEKLPELNEEYLVVLDLKDSEHPVVTSMDFDVKRKAFTDPRGTGEPLEMTEVLFWGELPEPPKIECKKIQMRDGKKEWGAEPGKHYFCLMLGEIKGTLNIKP